MMTPGSYLTRRRIADGKTIADVAAQVATEPRLAEHIRAELLDAIERDIAPATFTTLIVLRRIYRFDMVVLGALVARTLDSDYPLPDVCRVCGCSEHDACMDLDTMTGCAWADDARTICSCCVGKPS